MCWERRTARSDRLDGDVIEGIELRDHWRQEADRFGLGGSSLVEMCWWGEQFFELALSLSTN